MAYIVKAQPKQRCVFASCDHAPATHVYHHEFVGHPSKPMCHSHTLHIQQTFKLTVRD